MNNPKVSILTATYKRPYLLKRALESIKNQTYQNYEVVIVNDGGNSQAVKLIIANSGIEDKIILINYFKNQGPTKALQEALDNSSGDLAIQLDDDDEFLKNGIKELVSTFESPNLDATFAKSLRIKSTGEREEYPSEKWNITEDFTFCEINTLLKKNWCVSCSRMVKASVFKKIGFDLSLKVLVDWDVNLNLALNYYTCFHDNIVSIVHLSDDSWYQSNKKLATKEAEIIRKRYT